MEAWSFPTTAERLWNSLDSDRQEQIIASCANVTRAKKCKPILELIAEKRHTREQTLLKWPIERFEAAIKEMSRSEAKLILWAFVSKANEALPEDVREHIPRTEIDEGGSLRTDTLEEGIGALLKVHPLENVQLYMQMWYVFDPHLCAHLPEMDFARIKQLMLEEEKSGESDNIEIGDEEDETETGEPESDWERVPQPTTNQGDQTETIQSITDRLGDLRKQFAEIAEAFSTLAMEYAVGVIPDPSFDPNVSAIKSEFAEVAKVIQSIMVELEIPAFVEPPASLTVLDQAILEIRRVQNLRESSRHQIEDACQILHTVLSLRSKEGRDVPGLDACRLGAADLRAKIQQNSGPQLPPEILSELSSYETILRMLENGIAALDENPQAVEQIAKSFGAGLVFALGSGAIVATEPIAAPKLPTVPHVSEIAAKRHPSRTSAIEETGASASVDDHSISSSEAAPQNYLSDAASEESTTSLPQATCRSISESSKYVDPTQPNIETQATEETIDELHAIDKSADDDELVPSQAGFEPCEDETASACAAVISLANGNIPFDSLQRLMWIALSEQKYGAAYHLSHNLDSQTDSTNIWSTRIRAAILGQAIANPSGPIFEQLRSDFATIADAPDPDSKGLALAFRLLRVSSALRPAVLAPDSNASVLIEPSTISGSRLDKLYWLCKNVSDYANLQMPLDLAALEFIDTSVNFAQRFSALKNEMLDWWNRAHHLNLKYAPAAKIWKSWLDSKAPIGRIIQPILTNDRNSIADVKAHIESFSTDERIRWAINSDAKSIKHYGFEGSINYKALAVFTRHVREAVDLARRWVALLEHASPDQRDYRRARLLDLRMILDSAQAELKAELDQTAANATDMRVAIAAQFCLRSFDSLLALLHPARGQRTDEPPIKYLLSSDLLLVPGLPMTEEWEPLLSSGQLQRLLVSQLASSATEDWNKSLDFISENRRDHKAVDRIIDYLTWEKTHEELIDRLTTAQEQHLKQCQAALKRQIEQCIRAVEAGVSLGLVREHERAEFLDRIDQISSRLDSVRNFEVEEDILKGIHTAIESSRMRQVEHVKERIESEGVQKEGPAYERILAAMDRGDVDTANEYIDLILRNDELPAPMEQVNDSLKNFYPKVAAELETFLSADSANLASYVENGKSFSGVDMRQIPGDQLDEAVAMLDAWFTLKKGKRTKPEPLKTFFERLGFEVYHLSEPSGSQRVFLTLDVRPLTHRDRCPTPYFGSTAGGHYRVICLWDRPSEDEILNVVRQGRNGPPAIVLYFGRLAEQKRRAIAQQGRHDNLSFIVIDDLLVAFLCGVRGSRLPVMFDCTLPFTCLNPYTMTSSIVPPEMFYGRRSERDQIIDPMGSCFVYGGRQLGKTALLLSIRDEFHHPAEQRIALWIDLKSSTDDIWTVIARGIRDLADADLQIGNVQERQKLLERIHAWLDADKKRRFLLLLDEADRFLELDSKEDFSRTSSLKGLMEKTNRRFKVVFAGLHNVQRATKEQNHPLAHFGEPICIGPLLNRGEGKEARALIERPFWALGYRFESPDLIVRILSRTNYYPSLIQLYCYQIFQAIKLDNACIRSGPPFVITEKHVDEAYSTFQNPIREKFELTLNLDPRYRVLTLIIALNTLHGASRMMSVSDIRELAFAWWKQGFAELRTEEDFRVLLDEMQGLGILREKAGEYALRAVNLFSLLGSQDQIEQKLLQSADEAPPEPYSAHIHRTSDRKQYWRRNPLTDQQYNDLRGERNSVSLIFGSKAAGLDDVERFLAQAVDSSHYVTCDIAVSDRFAFKKFLENVREKAQSGTTLVIVRSSPWTTAWIQEATTMSEGRTRFTSVVFLADPATTWGIVLDRSTIECMVADRRLNSLSLQPWHRAALNSWLGDCSIGSNAVDEEKKISAITGRWPFLLDQFRSLIVAGNMSWQSALEDLCRQLNDRGARTSYMEAFGLKHEAPLKVLKAIVDLDGSASQEVLSGLVEGVSKPMIEAAFYWADRLNLIQPGQQSGEWVVDAVVQGLLKDRTDNGLVDNPGAA
ncbi:AAA family ATPase [Edaphobacter aggregans]|uniref:AAA family ATPase n=1 Tax=Edaphobacter aggregans TaxID=570835 RepID=UPI0012F72898|nr:ATP-binding protein [Edaphobacter aggregans]